MKYLKREINDEMTTYEAVEPDKYEPNDAVNSHLYLRTAYTPQSELIQEFPHERLYKENEQMELFRHHINPASNEVRTVAGTERGRTHFPLLLAVANNDSLRNFGIPLTPPDNLSRHSLKVAKNLQERGLISPDVKLPGSPTNSITFDYSPESHYYYEDPS